MKFLETIEEILKAAGKWEEFKNNEHFHARIENKPFMPLVIESWPSLRPLVGETRIISVAHYYYQNGDAIADPDVEITDTGWPINFTQPNFYQEITWRQDGRTVYHPTAKKGVLSFLNMWAGNLKNQGFIEKAAQLNKVI